MEEEDIWTSLFFSGICPNILETNEPPGNQFRPFGPEDGAEDDNWNLGRKVDISREPDPNTIQVFWLRIKGRSKYIAKVVSDDDNYLYECSKLIMYQFPGYSKEDAKVQLCRVSIRPTPERIDDAIYNFDRFYREARAYSHIDLLCSVRERIYFPQFHGVITNMSRSRFSSGYCHERAVVLEAIKPALSSRRVLVEHVEDVDSLSMSFFAILQTLSLKFFTTPEIISLSPFEQDWYYSLLRDRLRRLNTLHRIGITHGDIHDHHFRLPNDIYDTVLYDFSESYTFSKKQPFRVNHGRPRPLSVISEGERDRILHHIRDRAISRDLRSYLIRDADSKHTSSVDNTVCVDNALWQYPDKEIKLLELIMLRVSFRPDGQLSLIPHLSIGH
ncbi:hypothetical protein PENCOP_c006G04973 [Penicillium coprophilum]|uniref:Protein kinase domain-containing protein n=1 Tax=Penicillium coprophilum TaxID=36646 RepID=A0A1V6UNX5_9EURO|nr:hypothetical protein PENCOP_c006G04973 [Penicillium coprophilum]